VKRKLISIVLPALNEAGNIEELLPLIEKNIPAKYSYEIIVVDDGSKDKTFTVVSALAHKNPKIKGISLYRRFGHQAALLAGIANAKGEAIITMDSDFQHPPEKLALMLKLWEEGNDLVQMKKRQKEKGLFEPIRRVGYFIWSKASDGVLVPGASDFRLMDRHIAEFILQSSETEVFLRGVVQLAAKNPTSIEYEVQKRKHGSSSYTFNMFWNMFINGFISYSTKPIRLVSYVGLLISLIGAFFLISDGLYSFFSDEKIIEGWLTTVFLVLIMNGFIIFYLGILGEYLGVIFKEVKKRPKYIIEKTVNI
jgi:dolichol-phosphate mannosyltransferase